MPTLAARCLILFSGALELRLCASQAWEGASQHALERASSSVGRRSATHVTTKVLTERDEFIIEDDSKQQRKRKRKNKDKKNTLVSSRSHRDTPDQNKKQKELRNLDEERRLLAAESKAKTLERKRSLTGPPDIDMRRQSRSQTAVNSSQSFILAK